MTDTQFRAYEPNLKDRRVLSRIKTAYGFTKAIISATRPTSVPRTAFDTYYGQQQNPLSRWLRDTLTVCVDENFFFNEGSGKVKEYLQNKVGMAYVKSILKGESSTAVPETCPANRITSFSDEPDEHDLQVVREWAVRAYPELESLNFVYAEKKDRLHHGLQNVKTVYRRDIFNSCGLKFNYDISNAAPTLIWQHAQRHGMEIWPNALHQYLQDKHKYREHLASISGLSTDQTKVIITSLFNSAVLAATKHRALFGVVCKQSIDLANERRQEQGLEAITFKEYNPRSIDFQRMRALQADPWLKELRADIRACWDAIIPENISRVRSADKNGHLRLRPVTSSQKWALYFKLERQVMHEVQLYLLSTGNQAFFEHDGWRCKDEVDVPALTEFVFNQTGYKLNFEKETLQVL